MKENKDIAHNSHAKNLMSDISNSNENKCLAHALKLLAARATWHVMEGDMSVTVKKFKLTIFITPISTHGLEIKR